MENGTLASLDQKLRQRGRGRLGEQVASILTDMIVNGEWAPGELLPSEGELAGAFGVSRVALREATKLLEARGLVNVVQGKGIVVRPPDTSQASDSLRLLLQREATTLMELWQARMILETEIAALACQYVGPVEIEQLEEAYSRILQPDIDHDAAVKEDERFHNILIDLANNLVLRLIMDTIADLLHESRKRTVRRSGAARAMAGHKAVIEALRERNSDAAREAMRNHLEQARQDLEQFVEESPTSTDRIAET
jgi:GntR family transcriptional repressor for pyruvate dehydrogenase complex